MIEQIKIENYKSIASLELHLGRVNVFVGENGSGKTNILEAVALGSAASGDNLEDSQLSIKGMRISEPKMMTSGFKPDYNNEILIEFSGSTNRKNRFILSNDGKPFSKWQNKGRVTVNVDEMLKYIKDNNLKEDSEFERSFFKDIFKQNISDLKMDEYVIFAPEYSALRKFDIENGNVIGCSGNGLFSHIKLLSETSPEFFNEIRDNMSFIDWFEGFEIPKDLMFTERRIRIKDRYLEEGIQYIDQRSSNEGFLYLLFYVTLFISPYTPKFFAIDNVDNALNPKLCSRLLEVLVRLAKENGKQVILTAHNPGLLDGLNLNDEEQRLFVISRNKLGHTKALRIEQKPSTNGHEPVRLSEQFLRGYIGGLPKNF